MRKKIPALLLASTLLCSPLFAQQPSPSVKARQLINAGGGEITLKKSVPGIIKITGDHSFNLLSDANARTLAAAGFAQKGRVIAFSHGSFLTGDLLQQKYSADLILNSFRWAGHSQKPKIGLTPKLSKLGDFLKKQGFKVTIIPADQFSRKLKRVDVLAVIGHNLKDPKSIQAINSFVAQGGGLLTATTPWAFANQYPDYSTFPGNQIIQAAGLTYLPNGTAGKAPINIKAATPGSHAIAAAQELSKTLKTLSPSQSSQLIAQLDEGKYLTGTSLTQFMQALDQLEMKMGAIIPSKEKPIKPASNSDSAGLEETIIRARDHINQNAPARFITKIPAADDYPGAIPKNTQRISQTLTIDGKYKGWLSGRGAGAWAAKEMRPTGIYAPPGELIKVTFPEQLIHQGFEVVIGSYGGSLLNKDKWTRYPRLRNEFDIDKTITAAANGLGGMVSIRVPRDADYPPFKITIEGGVRAPLYVHGKTKLSDWKQTIRKYPAPWAELVSDRMIIALPSSYIRKLNDPDKVMEVWNDIIDTAAELVAVDRDDYRAERIVFDRQLSAGSMHSSYPVAAHIGKNALQAVDARDLRKNGNWGFFHEYGHNHQHDLWALPGTGETTCNLWSLYIYENLIGKKSTNTHVAVKADKRKKRKEDYFKNGRNFSRDWSMWTALEPYQMIQEEFGWEPFKKLFNEYNQLPKSEWPKTQQEKNDQFVIRLSKACGKNLTPFWQTWNLPLSDKVAAQTTGLPKWENHPVEKYAKP
ncbi:MAG: M60 family metallopeptidase [Verrucomicrobiales bacterium]|nr:M60 family metallopeptidase [Verrucomicrobiales bacterium]